MTHTNSTVRNNPVKEAFFDTRSSGALGGPVSWPPRSTVHLLEVYLVKGRSTPRPARPTERH